MPAILLNGEERRCASGTVAELLEELGCPKVGVAVAVNEQVVRRAEHSSTPLRDGDNVEVIRAVQGG